MNQLCARGARSMFLGGFALLVALCLTPSRSSAQIVVGPYTFSGPEAFADAVTYTGTCGGGSGYPSGPCIDNVLGHSPSVCNANMRCTPGDYGDLAFTDVPIVNGPGVDVVIFDSRFSADGYSVAAEVPAGSGSFTPFAVWSPTEQVDTGERGCGSGSLWGVPVDLSRLGVALGATVTVLRVGAADTGSGCQADLTMAAVLNGGSVGCRSDADCNDGNPCTTDTCVGTACTYAPASGPGCSTCGDGVVEPGEDCDDGGESATCDADCTAAACGDGTVNATAGESCDDGGESATCDADCTGVSCGDGVTNATAGETCDDAGPSATCDADCTAAMCGDGVTNMAAGEACDDAGVSASCDADCSAAMCGDGVLNMAAGEACDDGGESAGCDADCSLPMCGDGVTNMTAGEACDDAGESPTCNMDCSAAMCGDGVLNVMAGEVCDEAGETATCDVDCSAPACGDGVLNVSAGEACDDGGESMLCDADCTESECGDGTQNPTAGESCDDGNTISGDGCSALCVSEACGNSVVDEGESCDDGGASETCDEDCTEAVCGDGVRNDLAGEDCDDAGESEACDDDCTEATCGDGLVNATAGEECDDGNTVSGDGCSSACVPDGVDGGTVDGGSADGGGLADAGPADASVTGRPSGSGCSCSVGASRASLAPLGLPLGLFLLWVARRRRRAAR